MSSTRRGAALLVALTMLAACDDDSIIPDQNPATVRGSIEETTPASGAQAAPSRAPGTDAETVAVVQIEADGSVTTLAESEVDADGSFSVEGVPAGLEQLAVEAYVGARAAGRVLIHETTSAAATIRTAPINYETTVEGHVWSEVRAAEGKDEASSAELALMIHLEGAGAEPLLASGAELQAVANGYLTASRTLTAMYAELETELSAAEREAAVAPAAVEYAAGRNEGAALEAAHAAFTDAALDAYIDAGATLETIAIASAGAASTFDAALEGETNARGLVIAEPVHLNLRARERLAAEFSSSTEGALAEVIETTLAGARAAVAAATSVAEVKAAMAAQLSTSVTGVVTGAVELLAAEASPTVRAEVALAAQQAFEAAVLGTRFEEATTAEAAAEAAAGYRAEVRAAVDATVFASGAAEADAEALTSLFIAAGAGPYIR